MLKHRAQRLARRLIILSVLTAALLVVSTPLERKAAASIPFTCQMCENMFNNCLTSCRAFGPQYLNLCHNGCASRYNECISTCT